MAAWTRDRIVSEVRRLDAAGVRITEHALTAAGEKALVAAIRKHGGGFPRVRRLAGIANPVKRWTRRAIIAELRRQIREGATRFSRAFYSACEAHFGSMNAAREAARLPIARHEWTKEETLARIRELGNARLPVTLRGAARRWFGSVARARRLARVPARSWSDRPRKEVLAELRRVIESSDPVPAGLARACLHHFGSMTIAKRKAGVSVPKPWTRARVIRALRDADESSGTRIQVADAARRLFGSMEQAARAARVPVLRIEWTRERLLDALREFDGRRLTEQLENACRREFGSTAAARIAAGQRPLKMRNPTGARP